MINLSPKFQSIDGIGDTVVEVFSDIPPHRGGKNVLLRTQLGGGVQYSYMGKEIKFLDEGLMLESGEVVVLFFSTGCSQRFYRPSSNSNTILLTERCDQKCLMCSQPPKDRDYLHWELYKEAINFLPSDAVIGISGGEPTLFLDKLLDFIEDAVNIHPNIQFHILSNAQHFEKKHSPMLSSLRENILWGIPIYASEPDLHDHIVGKSGAFNKLLEGFNVLLSSSSRVEIRTVVLGDNYPNLLSLAQFLTTHLSWAEIWAIMQLEPIGFARIDWHAKFVDTSENFEILEEVLKITELKDMETLLYNFPICTVKPQFRRRCVKSISDWKQKYLDECEVCSLKTSCTGFFEWYNEEKGFGNIEAIQV